MENTEKVKSFPFYNLLSENDIKVIERATTVKTFEKGEQIRSYQDACIGMILVESGVLRVSVLSKEGREVTLFNINKGEVCVLSASCVISQISLDTEVTAREKTSITVISASAVKTIMENNVNFRCFVYELATTRFSTALWVLQEIIFAGFDKRLARYLCSYCDKNDKNEITLTQYEIAVDVGSSREVVARMLKHFSDDGYIEVKRGGIIIKNCKALHKIADL